jgi:predicted nucleotidyltransferase/plasmid maintenance system antidote protein VapI
MDNLGDILRKLREEKKLPLRKVAAYLDIDQAILSKIERGQRRATREYIVKLAKYFKVKKDDLMVAWLSDKLVYEVGDEQIALKALQVAEEKVAYEAYKKTDKKTERLRINTQIQRYFQSQNKISKAWLFGSFARGEDDYKSDIDIVIDVPTESTFTLFDMAEVKEQLQKALNKEVDVVMLNGLRTGVKERIKNEIKLIYEA